MKTTRRMLSLLLALVIVIGVLPYSAGAADGRDLADYQAYSQQTVVLEGEEYTSVEDAALALRQALKARETEIPISFRFEGMSIQEIGDILLEMAFGHTGDPIEGDYLRWQVGRHGWSCSYGQKDNVIWGTIYFSVNYHASKEQEAEMDEAVDALLNELDLWDASDYEKVVGVYEWMCQNITYDYDNLSDQSYTLKFSAYAALVNRTAVCQGYASLLYRLLMTLGVDNRVITGIGNGGAHAWNIVALDGLYYDADATWDAIYRQAGWDYQFFLLPEAEFLDHERDPEYLTDDFMASYPMSQSAYQPFMNGDIDLDGDVDAKDLTMLARHVAGIEMLVHAVALTNADVNCDGTVDANDLTMHARYVAGIITSW